MSYFKWEEASTGIEPIFRVTYERRYLTTERQLTKVDEHLKEPKMDYETIAQNIKDEVYTQSSPKGRSFSADLYAAFGVADNPKADLLFLKAWDLGHSNGYQEVLVYFSDLVDLIK